MITFREHVEAHLECLKFVLNRLQAHNCDAMSIAVIEGLIDGTEKVLEALDA